MQISPKVRVWQKRREIPDIKPRLVESTHPYLALTMVSYLAVSRTTGRASFTTVMVVIDLLPASHTPGYFGAPKTAIPLAAVAVGVVQVVSV